MLSPLLSDGMGLCPRAEELEERIGPLVPATDGAHRSTHCAVVRVGIFFCVVMS